MKLIYFLLFLFTLIISPASSSSLLSESQLLIKFKNSLPNPNVLKNWSPLYHTCSFFGVSCSSLADVIAIDLTGIPISATFSAVTASLLHLPNLRTLVLTSTNLTGDIKIRTNSSCGPHLRDVDVSDNAIAGSPPDVALFSRTCSSLKTFNLSNNLIAGRFAAGANLETLDLSYNRISTVANVIRIPFLKNLNLAGNVISGKIPSFSNCSELESFDISFNQVSDANLKALSSCTNLKALDLSSNSLTGELPVEELSALTALESVSLSNNSFSGKLRLEIFTSLEKLKILQLSFNNFSGELPASLSWNLEQLGLSSNGLTGSIPGTLCGNSSLKELYLQGNLLTGRIPASLSNCSELHSLDLSFNYLTGTIPASLGGLSQLKDLIMQQNLLEGEIPIELGLVSSLEYLILDYNGLTSDELPGGLGNCSNLYWISLSSNHLNGGIPKWIGGLKNLAVLKLGNNSFSGEIPKEIGDCTSLFWLDLNSNSLSGSIPASLAAQSGKIAGGLFTRKRFTLLVSDGGKDCHWSMNLLESDGIRLETLATLLPSQGTCSFTRVYTGSILSIFNNDRSMISLDLSHNRLEGEIPEEIGSMLSLLVLNLGHNLLSGLIPSELGNMTNVEMLDLSHNLLEGPIPSSFSGLSFLSELDLSYNKLNGTIPDSGQLATFPIYAYENNSGLCGYPLPICSKNLFPAQPNMDSTDVHISIIGLPFWIGLTTSFLGTISFFIVYWSDQISGRNIKNERLF